MGKLKDKEKQVRGMLNRAFIKARFQAQATPNIITRMNNGEIHPIAELIDTEVQSIELTNALNEAVKVDPDYKKGDTVSIKHLGGSAIPIFLITCRDTHCIFRLLPNESYIKSYSELQKDEVTKHYLPELYLSNDLVYRNQSYLLEILEYCKEGNLHEKAKSNHSKWVGNKQENLLKYAINILQIISAFREKGVIFPDIKPSNFLITDDDRIIIADVKTLLGINDKQRIPAVEIFKTPIYESGGGLSISHRSGEAESLKASSDRTVSINTIDLKARYMLGVTLYELATGHMVAEELAQQKKTAWDELEIAKNAYEVELTKNQKFYSPFQTNAQEATDAPDPILFSTLLSVWQKKELDFNLIDKQHPRSAMRLDHKVFKTDVGRTLKMIIESFTGERDKRIEINEAIQRLSELQNTHPLSKREATSEQMATSSSVVDGVVTPSVVEKKPSGVDKRGLFRTSASTSSINDRQIKSSAKSPELDGVNEEPKGSTPK